MTWWEIIILYLLTGLIHSIIFGFERDDYLVAGIIAWPYLLCLLLIKYVLRTIRFCWGETNKLVDEIISDWKKGDSEKDD